MFSITSEPINEKAEEAMFINKAAGALVVFKGLVRNHNDGRQVDRLEYESHKSMAQKEGNKIIAEALEKFDIIAARCTHRTGVLQLGDMAVWLGVSSAHRQAGFQACQYIIDEVKKRVPIWKKEHYSNGDSGWVNCNTDQPVTEHE